MDQSIFTIGVEASPLLSRPLLQRSRENPHLKIEMWGTRVGFPLTPGVKMLYETHIIKIEM
jgi:hypothetical protein